MTNEPQQSSIVQTADAIEGSWVYRKAPIAWRPYLKLARMDRPVGTWLLLWPCIWSLFLATDQLNPTTEYYTLLFAIGALAMRGAGCTYNDIIDRDIDGKVERTQSRPIPAGEVSVKKAFLFFCLQCAIGLLVLTQFNSFTIILGLSSILLILLYPFMKRITFWPQAWLGLTFNWGALMGWAAVKGSLDIVPIILYFGAVFWTLGYDTIYAHQDKEDDALAGVKSTALALGTKTKPALLIFYGVFILALLSLVMLAKVGIYYYISVAIAAIHLIWQVKTVNINNADVCLKVFRSNITFGWILTIGLFLERII